MKFGFLKGVHKAAHYGLRAAGFEWELRRNGDLKLGLWRRTLRTGKKTAFPRRLVLVPGFGDTPLSWLSVLTLLAPVIYKRFDEIVVVDFPGFTGFLADERGFHDVDLLVEAIGDLHDSLRPEVILGHSLGGYLTARYAAACGAGERPRAKGYAGPKTIILMDPSGVFRDEATRQAWIDRFVRAVEGGVQHLRPFLFRKEPPFYGLLLGEVNRFFTREETVSFIKSVKADHGVEPLLPQIRANTWLIWGEEDTLIPPADAHLWMRALVGAPSVRGVLLKSVGHSPHVEAPVSTAALLAQVLLDKLPHRVGNRWWKLMPA